MLFKIENQEYFVEFIKNLIFIKNNQVTLCKLVYIRNLISSSLKFSKFVKVNVGLLIGSGSGETINLIQLSVIVSPMT